MKKFLATLTLLFAFTLPGFAQGQVRLSAEDQKKFDKHYSKWVNDTRKNDRDDIAKDVHEMQEIMARNNIPANVPYDHIASPEGGARDYSITQATRYRSEYHPHYTKSVNDTRRNSRADV